MVLLNYRMRLTFTLLVLCVVHANMKRTSKHVENEDIEKTSKSATEHSSGSPLKKLLKNAIIAIEVVDPNDNTTNKGKGRKRTIESALGYGYTGEYQNFFSVKTKPPKYEVYKYSQHDILPYKGSVRNKPAETYPEPYRNYNHASTGNGDHGHGSSSYSQQISHYEGDRETPQFEIQKSVQYDIGSTKPVYEPTPQKKQPNLQQYYQHGTTLFSSVDNNGHLSSLSQQVPSNPGPMVPVIILRVYTNQLGQNSLHANIPEGHPYANLNSVDLQSLLAGYVQNNPRQQAGQQYYQAPPQSPQHQAEPEQTYYQEPTQRPIQGHYSNEHRVQSHQNLIQNNQNPGLLTNENYPDDAHTKVIFKKPDTSTKTRNKPRAKTAQKFKITIPENTYSKVEVQEHTYGRPHDGGQYVQQHVQYAQPQEASLQEKYEQEYYYQQPDHYNQYQQPHHGAQQEYQSSKQSVVEYQQVQPNNNKDKYIQSSQTQYEKSQVQPSVNHIQADQYINHDSQQQIQQQGQEYQQYDAKQYVQIATYPSQTNPEQQTHSPQHGAQVSEEYYQQYIQYVQQQEQQHRQQQIPARQTHEIPVKLTGQQYQNPTGTEVQYLQRSPEQGTENQDYAIVKHSNDAGRDLHPKLYNYHAHESSGQQSTPKKKRERKQRRSRVPLVLAPEVMSALDKKH